MEMRPSEDALVGDIMDAIQAEWGVPHKYQRLLYRGHQLRPGQRISDLGIKSDDELILQSAMKGGCLWLPTGNGGGICCGVCNIM